MNFKKIIRNLPGDPQWLVECGRQVNLIFHIFFLKVLRFLRGGEQPSPENIYWIDPKSIIYHTNYLKGGENVPFPDRVFDPIKDRGKICDGSWDITDYKFSDLLIFKALKERILAGVDWEKTEYFQNLLKDFEKGVTLWGCSNREDLIARCQYLDTLIKSVRKNGFKQNYLVKLKGETNSIAKTMEFSDEISVNIGRNGQYLFQDGRHRLAIAQILNLDIIPVKVLVRHKEWVEFREAIKAIVGNTEEGVKDMNFRRSPLHSDLEDLLPFTGCIERFEAASRHVVSSGVILDLSGNFGFYSHKFEELGYLCYAVQASPKHVDTTKKLKEIFGKKFHVINSSWFDLTDNSPYKDIKFDVVLALSEFSSFLQTKEDLNFFVNWLNRVNVKELVLEIGEIGFDLALDKHNVDNCRNLVDYIIAKSIFNYAQVIYCNSEHKKIFRFYA